MFERHNHEKLLAQQIVNHSCKIKENEKVLITYNDCPHSFIEFLIEEIFKLKAIPIIYRLDNNLKRRLLINSNIQTIETYKDIVSPIMSSMDAVIIINGSHNDFELSDIPNETMNLYNQNYVEPIHFDIRCTKKWVLLRTPTPAFAQNSKMSSESFYDFFYRVCTLDYDKLDIAMTPLKELMEKTDKVRIETPNTNLTFSIKGMPAIKCSGQNNIPDGEIYTAPIKDSANGYIFFNIPAIEKGKEFNKIKLTIKNGKIIDHDCNDYKSFEKILNTDNGSRYLGEFAFGLNPYATRPLNDILFDEKMTGSIHLAIGSCYKDCNNNNDSAIHLDLVLNLNSEYGGGKIYFDNQLIYENGRFILPNLVDLNPEKLL